MKARVIQFTFAVMQWNEDVEGTITGRYEPGAPAVMYLRNGDPGYPADPPEFEVHEVTITDIAGKPLAEPITLDNKGQGEFYDQFKDKIDQWATDAFEEQYYEGEP